MYAILRQTKANLKSHKLQVSLILLTLLAATTLLTLALSTLHTAQGAYDRLFQRTRGAHLWLRLDPQHVTAQEAERILADLANVEASTAVMRQVRGTLFKADDERLSANMLREWPQDTGVGRLLLVGGRAPQPGEMDAIALDRNVASTHGIKVGDALDLLTPNGLQSLTVVGLVVSAEACPYPVCSPAHEYLAPGAMTELGLLPSPVSGEEDLSIGLRLRDPSGIEATLQAVQESLPAKSIRYWDDWRDIRRFADAYIRIPRIFLLSFGVVAGLAAGFLIANAISGAARAQARQVGLLKAVGFTRGQLALVYLLEYLGLALAASLVGLGLGILAASAIMAPITALFGATASAPPLWIVLFVPLGALLISTLAALWPVLRATRLDVVEAIRVGAERPRRRMARLLRMPPPLALGLSDVLSRPLRSTLTTLGLGVAVIALTAALTMSATLQNLLADDLNLRGVDGDLFLYPPLYLSETEVQRIIAEQADVSASLATVWGEFRLAGGDETLFARFREGDVQDFEFPLLEGRVFESADEVVVGYGLAHELNLHPGDALTILLQGESWTFQVAGVYRESSNLGRMLLLPTEALRRVQPNVKPFEHALKLRPRADVEAVAEALVRASDGLLEVDVGGEGSEALGGLLDVLPNMGSALYLTLGGIAVLGIFNSVWMGVQERRREFGMLKAVGMTPGQVTISVLVGAASMALVAYVVALPLGLTGIRWLIDVLARSIGFGPLTPPVHELGLALLLPGIVLLALLGAFIPAHRAGRTSVVETLRYE